MTNPRLLDLYCGAFGAGMGYVRAGFDVTGIDLNEPTELASDRLTFIQGDVLDYLSDLDFLRSFDAIHASPPCQSFTAYRRKGHGVGDSYPNLIPQTRAALIESGLPYVIENVPGAPLNDPVQLCGSSFGLDVRRHRLFESNIALLVPPCDHSWQFPRFPSATNRKNLRSTVEVGVWRIPLDVQHRAMGIDWMTREELSQAIPPAYTEHLGRLLLDAVEAERRAA